MNTYLRAHHIGRLIEGLRLIAPGAVFERFGGKFLDQYLAVPLTHRGLNVLGHPVGGTVDTVGENGRCAAEYSTEKTYFDGTMAKPTADAEHARALNPNATDIFLLSSQEAPIGKITDFQTTMQGRPDFDGRTFHVYDSRKIAEILVDHLLVSDTAVDQLSDQLPILKAVRDEHAANLSIPELDYRRHVERPDVLAEIGRRLTAHRCLAIWGLAGAGKSELATAFANQHKGSVRADALVGRPGHPASRRSTCSAAPPWGRKPQRRNSAGNPALFADPRRRQRTARHCSVGPDLPRWRSCARHPPG